MSNAKVNLIQPKNQEEFDAFLATYQKQNPVKFKIKMENGEFEKIKAELGIVTPPKVTEVTPEVTEPAEAQKRGRKSKAETSVKEETVTE